MPEDSESKKLVEEFKQKKFHLINKYNKAQYAKRVDKVLFILGAVGLQLNYFFLGMFPYDFIFIWHLIQTIVMLVYKFLFNKEKNMHYFYFDFCYFGTFITYVFLFFF